MNRCLIFGVGALMTALLVPSEAAATASSELYQNMTNGYGRYEARIRFAAGDGIVSSFFLWKDGSEQAGTFWNELDFEKIDANCRMTTNTLYGNPVADHGKTVMPPSDFCDSYHVYTYEWLADSIAWFIDGVEIRRETGDTARAYAENTPNGMAIHFNVWPGDNTFGGNFNPSILPIHQYIDWIQFSAHQNGAFTLTWREDFNGPGVPAGWSTADWSSPKNLSKHDPRNVNIVSGVAVLSMTADDATGAAGATPLVGLGTGGGGAPGSGGAASGGQSTIGGNASSGGTSVAGASSASGAGNVAGGASVAGGSNVAGCGNIAGGTSLPGAGGNGAPAGAGGTSSSAPNASPSSSSSSCSFGPVASDRPTSRFLALSAAFALLAAAGRRRARAQ